MSIDLSPVQPSSSAVSADPLVSLRSVSKHYRISQTKGLRTRHATLRAVDDVSLDIARGETVGLVGESGSGKSTLGRLAVRLLEATEGSVRFDGQDITHLPDRRMRALRRNMQVVFQDPMGSIDPRMTVGEIIGEPLAVLEGLRGRERTERVAELLDLVGLDPGRASSSAKSLSGGQRQRIGIARAIAVNPAFILADEPVSALDVSVQAQISNLLVELRERLSLTYLFIGHGLPIVRQVAQRVAVMYLGRVVEIGRTDDLFERPLHPYTTALISASPEVGTGDAQRERVVLAGDPPSATDLPSGCRFRTRCPIARDICAEVAPPRIDLTASHSAECHFPGEFS